MVQMLNDSENVLTSTLSQDNLTLSLSVSPCLWNMPKETPDALPHTARWGGVRVGGVD